MTIALAPRRIAMLSVHTSPLDQPGVGDAGGMNVYIVELARRLAELNVEVEVFTRQTSGDQAPLVEVAPGVVVRHVSAGPFEGLAKNELPSQLCAFTSGVLRAEASRSRGWYDLVHSHYWLSGQVGWLAKERWGVPLVHSMHTMARVKNAALADGDTPEPAVRLIGEQQVVRVADRLLANTADEADQLIELYDADPDTVSVVHPGVDLDLFSPGDVAAARAKLGIPADSHVLLFAGRIQPLKAPDVLIKATAQMLAADPQIRDRLVVAVVGGPSGSGLDQPESLVRLAGELGVADIVRFEPPVTRSGLVDWLRAASVVIVPSYNESFGLVAIEAQACGTPVVAASVGGLRTAVADKRSGYLVAGHDPRDYAEVLARLLNSPAEHARLSRGARNHALNFGWADTAAATLSAYREAMAVRHDELIEAIA